MADTTFITNHSDKKLKDRIAELIGHSKELKFLVGFFYFSGIRELYDSLKNPDKQAQVKEYEYQIDQMVYELYGLTPEEIEIIEGSAK